MKLIDADQLKKEFYLNFGGVSHAVAACELIDKQPNIAAFRSSPTREQVEKVWRGEWISYLDGEHIMPERYYSCSKCGNRGYSSKRNFCDFCGAPITDEAVEITLRKLEALKNETI